jgi:hypothetical protein
MKPVGLKYAWVPRCGKPVKYIKEAEVNCCPTPKLSVAVECKELHELQKL